MGMECDVCGGDLFAEDHKTCKLTEAVSELTEAVNELIATIRQKKF
ncbi:unnamed protein product [marine sediment metagenome]|uniref:Uncharacterized protein n=1 Tax=marine sediment metagenome TaxID=412755 RepID=X0ZN75_9ZZZZ